MVWFYNFMKMFAPLWVFQFELMWGSISLHSKGRSTEGSLLFMCYCYLIKECRWSFVNPPSMMKGKQCHNCFHVMLQNDFFPAFMPVTCRYDGIPFFCLLQNRFIAWWCGQKVSLLAHVSNYYVFRKDSWGTMQVFLDYHQAWANDRKLLMTAKKNLSRSKFN